MCHTSRLLEMSERLTNAAAIAKAALAQAESGSEPQAETGGKAAPNGASFAPETRVGPESLA
jgi:hypothetical protein